MTMRDVEFAGGELRRDGGLVGIKREEETDIRLMIDKSGTFEREMAGLKLPNMFESPFQVQSKDFLDRSHISPDIINIANHLLNGLDDNFPMMNLEDVPFLNDNMNDDIDNLDNHLGGPNGPPNQDQEEDDHLFDAEMKDEVADLADGKRDNQKRKRKQVQFIRSQLLKFDKKILLNGPKQNRKPAAAQQAGEELDDQDDLIKSMSNLILKSNLPVKSPWSDTSSFLNNTAEMSTMIYERGGASNLNLIRSSKKESKGGLRNDQSLLAVNPHIESFLSFNDGAQRLNLHTMGDNQNQIKDETIVLNNQDFMNDLGQNQYDGDDMGQDFFAFDNSLVDQNISAINNPASHLGGNQSASP